MDWKEVIVALSHGHQSLSFEACYRAFYKIGMSFKTTEDIRRFLLQDVVNLLVLKELQVTDSLCDVLLYPMRVTNINKEELAAAVRRKILSYLTPNVVVYLHRRSLNASKLLPRHFEPFSVIFLRRHDYS